MPSRVAAVYFLKELKLSARTYDRILKVARIANLAGSEACVPSWPTAPRAKLYNGRD